MPRFIAIVDYGAGNLHSVRAGVWRVASQSDEVVITNHVADIDKATHIILPGVGAFGDCVNALKAQVGMIGALERNVLELKKPFLGICVGMQMLLERGHEHGVHDGLGWLKGEVVAIQPEDASFKVPHMGWNELSFKGYHPLIGGLEDGAHVYFVHSYQARLKQPDNVIAVTDYGSEIPAIIGYGNIVGTQFHPEKSQKIGAKVLENFLKMG